MAHVSHHAPGLAPVAPPGGQLPGDVRRKGRRELGCCSGCCSLDAARRGLCCEGGDEMRPSVLLGELRQGARGTLNVRVVV